MLRLRAWDMDHFVIYSAVMDDAIPPKFEIKFLKCESTLECFLKRCWVGKFRIWLEPALLRS
jgi:hypothetical protein